MKITSENLRILETGIVFSFKNQSLKFDLDPQLQLTMSFKDDSNNPARRMESKNHGINHGELILINFNEIGGTGYLEPAKIGDIGNENVYFFFWVTKVGSTMPTKKVEYTFYIGGSSNGY